VKRTRRKRLQRALRPRPILTAPNQEWAVDFVSEVSAGGRRLRIFTVVDSYTRECLALEVDTSLPNRRMTRALAEIMDRRGAPVAIRSDNVLNASAFFNKEYTSRVDRFRSDPRLIRRRTRLQWSSRLIGTPSNIMNTRSAPEAWSSLRLKRRRVPVEGPSITSTAPLCS
jgi:transposase InsO family protein